MKHFINFGFKKYEILSIDRKIYNESWNKKNCMKITLKIV